MKIKFAMLLLAVVSGFAAQAQWVQGTSYMYYSNNIGIGFPTPIVTPPATKLHVLGGPIRVEHPTEASIDLKTTTLSPSQYFNIGANAYGFYVYEIESASYKFTVNKNGNVAIGLKFADAKLTVDGDIHAKEVRVDLGGVFAPDYVFEEDYKLPSLTEVHAYIKQHKHLPEVPSAKEMEEKGVELKEMNMILLKKVEELTLHAISQEEKINALEKALKALEAKVK